MIIENKIPFYAKTALVFVGLFAFIYTMYLAQEIIIPILFATIVAILLNPFVNYFLSKGMNKTVAISIAVLFGISIIFGFLMVISSQVTMLIETYPELKIKFNQSVYDLVKWSSERFNIRQYKINNWVNENQASAIESIGIGDLISNAGRMLFVLVLLPVYVSMILYYKPLLLEFVRKLFKIEYHIEVAEVLINSKKIIQTYVVGLFVEMLIVAILNSAGLLLLGIDYALILGVTGAILNIIPYIGGLVATALPMIIAFITKDSSAYPLMVLVLYIIIQFIDNNFIIPLVVAKRVKINALISIIVVLIGGALWGLPGVFLSIPLTAIIKVVFDHIEPLKPWGFLLGNIIPTASKFSFIKTKQLKKIKT